MFVNRQEESQRGSKVTAVEVKGQRPALGTRGEGFGVDARIVCVCVCVCYLQPTWCTPECVREAVGERRRDFTRLFEQEGEKKLMKN